MRWALIPPILALALACGHRSDNSVSAPKNPAPGAFVWPQFNDVPPADALVITDAAGDQTLMPEGPPTVVPVPFTDITQVRAWRSGDWLYVRADFAGAFPTEGAPVVQGETILTNGVNLVMDSDHSYETGAHNLNLVDGVALGVDLLFAMGVYYNHSATPSGAAYALYDIGALTDIYGGQAQGELRGGGPGTSYLCARWALSSIPAKYWVSGTPALVLASAETESTNYHHYAFDCTVTKTWTLP